MEFEGRLDVFSKASILGVKGFCFSKNNIIIGENGAGKSRFLRAVRDYYESKQEASVIYIHFPDVSHVYSQTSGKPNANKSEKYDFDSILAQFNFKDFMKYIENKSMSFLEDMIAYSLHYARLTKRNRINEAEVYKNAEKHQKMTNKFLQALLHRKLHYKNDKLYIITQTSDKKADKKAPEQPLGDALKLMSPGELMLFWMIIFIVLLSCVNIEDSGRRLVLILDEPEGHLHPKAFLEFLDLLRTEIQYEQCWVATHSIFIIPKFKFDEIVYIHDGKISRSRRTYADIYKDVVGDDESVAQFLYDSDMWQYYHFVAECFYRPKGKTKSDPKDAQFLEFLNFIKGIGGTPEVLDYGAGAGRIGKTIQEMNAVQTPDTPAVTYTYYDKYSALPNDLECYMTQEIADLFTLKKKFHCVILMNVLHEIDVTEWYSTFENIERLLEDGGYLLLFEAKVLTNGEQPYGKCGYLLLNQGEVNALFNSDEIKAFQMPDSEKGNRQDKEPKTAFFPIPKSLLKNICAQTIHSALSMLRDTTFKALKQQFDERIHVAGTEEKQNIAVMSRRYGFQSQLYLNALFALERYENYIINGNDEYSDVFEDPLNMEVLAGKLHSARGKNLEANELVSLYSKIIEMNSMDADYYSQRGKAFYEMKKYANAVLDYSRAIEMNSMNVNYYSQRGKALHEMKEYANAALDYSSAIELDSKKAYYYNERGIAYAYLDERDKAISDYSKAIELDQTHSIYYYNRGKSYFVLKKYDEALPDYDEAIALDANNATFYDVRGNTYYCMERYDEALSDFRRAIRLDSKNAAYCNNRGRTYYKMEEYAKALSDFNKAVGLAPENEIYQKNRDNAQTKLESQSGASSVSD